MSTTRATRKGGKRTGFRRFLPSWKWVLGTVLGVLVVAVGAIFVIYRSVSVPEPNRQAVQQSNIWEASDGTVLARTGSVNRENVPLSAVPLPVQHAFVALENKTFYKDRGVDLKGTARGVLRTLTGSSAQGGSTITQQYVKNYYLDQDQTVSRKLKEIVIAVKVDRTMSKGEILDGYLNTSYFGRNAYGIQAAAQAYFGVDAKQLTTAQGAYLAALVQAPSQYDMATATAEGKRLATGRFNRSLDSMVSMHWLTAGERAAITFPKLRDAAAGAAGAGVGGQAGYLVQAATQYLTSTGAIDDKTLAAGGWRIRLTIDPKKEKQLERAVQRQLDANLKPSTRKADRDAQTGAVSVDPKTGNVLALYGGSDYLTHFVNNATRTDYQVASTFKPIVLAAALESGARTRNGTAVTPGTVYDGTSGRAVTGGTVPFAPPNEDGRNYGPITVQRAMNYSVNSVFAQLAQDAGLEQVRKTAIALGLPAGTTSMGASPSIALGVATPSALQMAGVYATLDNHGRLVVPTLVKSATRGDEAVALKKPAGQGTQVVERTTADTVTQVLRGVVDDPSGSGAVAADLGRQVAGKTGTSDDNKSAWFIGYTPQEVTAVGMFGETAKGGHTTLHGVGGYPRVNGGGFPTRIWTDYMAASLAATPATPFTLTTGPAWPTAAPSPTPSPSDSATATPTPSASPSTGSPAAPTPTPSASTGSPAPSVQPSAPAASTPVQPSGPAASDPAATQGTGTQGTGGRGTATSPPRG